jgi:hypothetical protein
MPLLCRLFGHRLSGWYFVVAQGDWCRACDRCGGEQWLYRGLADALRRTFGTPPAGED